MNHAHFAFFTQLGNGHVYPVLPLCQELARRGHRVTYVTNTHYARMIAEAGCEPITLCDKRLTPELKEELNIGLTLPISHPIHRNALRSWQAYCFEEAAELIPKVDSFYNETRPDLVLYDRYNVTGRVMSERLGAKAVQLSPHFAYYKGFSMRRDGVYENSEEMIESSRRLDSFLSAYGIQSIGGLWHLERLNIHFLPKEFQHSGHEFGDQYYFAGALLNRPFRQQWRDESGRKPIVLISGMSVLSDSKLDYSGYFNMIVNGLADLPCHCILSIGDDEFRGELPSNFEVNRRASHLEILPKAALSVCHGGMGSVLESLYHGVPVLMIPQSEYCHEVAYRAEELGLGLRVSPRGLTPERLRQMTIQMLGDCQLLDRVRNMREIFKRSGCETEAARRIEDYCVAHPS